VAREYAPVLLAPNVGARLAAARDVVERAAREDQPFYGITTALGASKDVPLADDDRIDFQRRIVMGRAVAVGPSLPSDVVRAIVLARASAMAAAGSGVSPAVLETLLAMLNARVHPIVPRWGSVGAADLGLLATLALPLIGLGEAELGGERLSGAEAMKRAGIAPVALGAKDGLALVSANSASVGDGALVVWDALATIDAITIAGALSMEAFRANLSPLDPRVQAARPAPGQNDAAARLREILRDSALWRAGAARSSQDPLSFRCASAVLGAALTALRGAERAILVELVSSGDNPLVLAEERTILHTGNFHVAALAQSFDLVAIALAHVASAAAERVIKLLSPRHSGLPLNLTRRGAARTGFATVQKTLSTLVAEMHHLAQPGSLDFMPVSEGIEDHATNAPWTVRKAADAVERLFYVAAIELMIGAQAVDLRASESSNAVAPETMGSGALAAWKAVRAIVPMLEDDRPPGSDIERLRELVVSRALAERVREALSR
jgi:histidine ammonia-lyase